MSATVSGFIVNQDIDLLLLRDIIWSLLASDVTTSAARRCSEAEQVFAAHRNSHPGASTSAEPSWVRVQFQSISLAATT